MNDTERLNHELDAALASLKAHYGNKKDDYYGLIFLERIVGVPRAKALEQVAFGNHDLGIDGYHFDTEQETFRIFQFKNSKSARLFESSLLQIHNRGLRALFDDLEAVPDHQPIVDSLRDER